MKIKRALHYVNTRLDTVAVINSLAIAIATPDEPALSETDQAVLAALRSVNPELQQAELADIQAYLQNLDESQIMGLVSNVKGVLHEMEFVKMENEDGDTVFASLFAETNHAATDIALTDEASGLYWELQLKSTDNPYYVQDWIDEHPDEQIAISSELAEKMDLPSSGSSNEELTVQVQTFVKKLLETEDADTLWNYLPVLGLLNIGVAIYELWQAYQQGSIDMERFKWLAAKLSGLKMSKMLVLAGLLSIPIIGVVVSAFLITQIVQQLSNRTKSDALTQAAS